MFCHDCRFCCTLSVCTNQHGTYYKESSEKNMNGSTNKALGAIAGFSLDMELYKKPDFREIYPAFSFVESFKVLKYFHIFSYFFIFSLA